MRFVSDATRLYLDLGQTLARRLHNTQDGTNSSCFKLGNVLS